MSQKVVKQVIAINGILIDGLNLACLTYPEQQEKVFRFFLKGSKESCIAAMNVIEHDRLIEKIFVYDLQIEPEE